MATTSVTKMSRRSFARNSGTTPSTIPTWRASSSLPAIAAATWGQLGTGTGTRCKWRTPSSAGNSLETLGGLTGLRYFNRHVQTAFFWGGLDVTKQRVWGRLCRPVAGEYTRANEIHGCDPFTLMAPELGTTGRLALSFDLAVSFSKKGTAKQFMDGIDESTIKNHIRPYIEKYLHEILEVARDNRFPIYIKDKSNRNVFPECAE